MVLVTEAARTTVRAGRPMLGSALLACAGALFVGGGVVAGAFAASWGLFLQARGDAEFSIASEDSYVAYADQWDGLVRVALVAFPLLLLVAMTCVPWLLTAQAVIVAHTRRRSGGLPLRAVWDRSRGHLGAALRVQALTVACAVGPALAGLAVLVAVEEELVPGMVRPTCHDPATVQFILVGRILPVLIWAGGLVLLGRFSLATAIRVADGRSATAAMRRSWTLTRAARSRTTGL
ncbi:hypothetical protein [Streptomyces nigra]|uniref:hypothetical protein n=1 Tax=Streptomyces nigra TaxID=1827580 RepID=UPI000D5271C5|nr:hypothetical protein [Streptomyces nigra]AWE48514.1 hypothetical protein DC008_01515 [Streptomyces nigra]